MTARGGAGWVTLDRREAAAALACLDGTLRQAAINRQAIPPGLRDLHRILHQRYRRAVAAPRPTDAASPPPWSLMLNSQQAAAAHQVSVRTIQRHAPDYGGVLVAGRWRYPDPRKEAA